MVDPVGQKIVTEIGNVAEKAVERSAVSSSDASAFQAQVSGAHVGGAQAASAVPEAGLAASAASSTAAGASGVASSAATGAAPGAPPSMGDRILSGLEGMSNDMQSARQKFVQDVGDGGTVGQMYKMQLDVAQLTTNQTIIGQAGSKTSQGVQTLLKGQ